MGAISIAPAISIASRHFSINFWHLTKYFELFSFSILQIGQFCIKNQKKKSKNIFLKYLTFLFKKRKFFLANFFGIDYFQQRTISADFNGRFYYGRVILNLIWKIRGVIGNFFKDFGFSSKILFSIWPHSAISIAPAKNLVSFYFAAFRQYLKDVFSIYFWWNSNNRMFTVWI